MEKQRGAWSRKMGEKGRVGHKRGGDPTSYNKWGPKGGPANRGPRGRGSK